MKIAMKILAALAAIVGVVYVVATYGDKIVAWARNLLGKAKSLCCCDGDCCCDDDCCCDGDCCCEDDCCCDGDCCCEDALAEEAPVEGEVAAEEGDFEG